MKRRGRLVEVVEDRLEEVKKNLIIYKNKIFLGTGIELQSFRTLFDQHSSEWELLSNLKKIEILSYINSTGSDSSLEDIINDYKTLNIGLKRPDINKEIELSISLIV